MPPSLGRGLCRVGIVRWLWRQRSSSAYLRLSRGRRFVQEYRGLPDMVGHSGCCLAFVLAAMVFTVMVAAHGKISRQADDATYRAYRILTHEIFVMLVVFFLAGERITWIDCLTGFGWRAWLLLYALLSWF